MQDFSVRATTVRKQARRPFAAMLAMAATLSACGGGGGGSGSVIGGGTGGGPTAGTPTPTPTPTPAQTGQCSLRSRQDWVAAQMREWYLFPETLPAALDPAGFTNLDDYLDGLTATARAQRRDRFFTYVTSIAGENAFFSSGSSAGYGFRLAVDASNALVVAEAFEGTAALAAGIDRGAQILAIGTTAANVRAVQDIVNADPNNGLTNALGPDTPGTARFFQFRDAAGTTRTVSVAKTDYALTPVSSRYGVRIIDEGGRRTGYLNLRTFISTADPQLRAAFQRFRTEGVTDLIVDFRYNGGGLVSTAELMGDLMGANRTGNDIFNAFRFRPEKASENRVKYFAPQPESIAPMRVAFIGTSGTASASELVINAFVPYLQERAGLIGANTFGKPVGQIALDQPACDDRLRVVAFAGQNRDNQGDYYNGLAATVRTTCRAGDDLTRAMGDPQEGSTRAALDFLAGRSCTPITAGQGGLAARTMSAAPAELLTPERPSAVQREVPGTF